MKILSQGGARLRRALIFLVLTAITASAQTTNALSDAEVQGRNLAQELCNSLPTENLTNTGVLEIRNGESGTVKIPMNFESSVTKTNWSSIYSAALGEDLTVVHNSVETNQYRFHAQSGKIVNLSGNQTMFPFAGSDFWICDFGLEFFHWPDQKIIKKEFMRGRGCMVLESANPNPTTNGYSRVDSWIDEESLGIVHAEAYDANGKLLKIFDPKSFKKVNGQWELQDMEIRNVQSGSRTRIKFDLKAD